MQEAQHNSSTPMPSAKHSASLRESSASGRSQHNASPASTPTARRLDSLEASQVPSTAVKPSLESTLDCRTETPAGSTPAGSGPDTQEHPSELGITQPNAEVQGAVEQRQQKASGPFNRHLSEEDDQEEEDDADDSEASDTDDEEDSDEEDEADEPAADSWQVLCRSLGSTPADTCNACRRMSCVPVVVVFCEVCEACAAQLWSYCYHSLSAKPCRLTAYELVMMPADTQQGAAPRINWALAGPNHHFDIPGGLQGALSAASSGRQRAQHAEHSAGVQAGHLAQPPAIPAAASTEPPVSIQRQSS